MVPGAGIVRVPYDNWRSGDHDDRGVLLVRAKGVAPGRRTGRLRSVDIGVTAAASLGIEFPDLDGRPAPDLVPTDGAPVRVRAHAIRGPRGPAAAHRRVRGNRRSMCPCTSCSTATVAGVTHIVHATRMDAEAARVFADDTRRVTDDAATAAADRRAPLAPSSNVRRRSRRRARGSARSNSRPICSSRS